MRKGSRSKRPSRRQVALLSIVLAISILGSIGIYFYLNGIAQKLVNEYQADKTTLAQNRQLASELVRCKSEYVQTRDQLAHLERSMPTRAYVPTLLQQIEILARNTNTTVTAIRPEENASQAQPNKTQQQSSGSTGSTGSTANGANNQSPQTKADSGKVAGIDYDTQDFAIEIQGKYWDLVHFVEGLSAFPKIMAVDSVSISPSSGPEGNTSRLNLRINVTAYLLKEEG